MTSVMPKPDSEIHAGVEPGLRFATLICADGSIHDLTWDRVRTWTPDQGFLWVHLERDDPTAQAWLCAQAGIDPLVGQSLLDEDSRPRVQDVGDALLVVLRGVNVAEDPLEAELVPIHVWIEATRCISLRDRDHQLSALRDIRLLHMSGRGPRTPGSLLAVIAEKVVDHLTLVTEAIEDEVDALEDDAAAGTENKDFRADISWARRRAIGLRRYLGPQRDALYRLLHDDATWLDNNAKARLREVTERLRSHIEDLDALRDRATVLHEDLSTKIAEKAAQTSHRLTGVAAMLIPPTIITSALGANIGGIPGADDPNAFWYMCAGLASLIPGSWLVLKLLRWM